MLAIKQQSERRFSALRDRLIENGDSFHAREFLRRFEASPEIKKAELIEGRVFMGSPVRASLHAKPDSLVQTWLGTYAAQTPGRESYTNPTLILDTDNVFQPDGVLCVSPERGGRCKVDAAGYLTGAAELVVEIAASRASIDLTEKLKVYRRNGVAEYIVWRTADKALDWFFLEGDEYRPQKPDPQHLIRSRAFPGLVLNVQALLELDAAAVLRSLQDALSQRPSAAT